MSLLFKNKAGRNIHLFSDKINLIESITALQCNVQITKRNYNYSKNEQMSERVTYRFSLTTLAIIQHNKRK